MRIMTRITGTHADGAMLKRILFNLLREFFVTLVTEGRNIFTATFNGKAHGLIRTPLTWALLGLVTEEAAPLDSSGFVLSFHAVKFMLMT